MKIEQRLWSATTGWQPSFEAGSLAGAQLVLLFGELEETCASECFARVRAHYPVAHVIGCTTAGQIHGTRVTDDKVTLTAVRLEHSRVELARDRIDGVADSRDAGARVVPSLPKTGLRHVFVLSEGLQVNASELVHGVDSALPDGVTVSGGCAGDGNRLAVTHVWGDSEPERATVVAVGFYGERLQIGISAIGGWRPFGPDRVITRSSQNVLFEFDGRPALELYKQYLGKHAEGLPASGLMFPLEYAATNRGDACSGRSCR